MKKLIPLLVVGMILCVGCEKKIVGTVLSKDESRWTREVTIVETNTYGVSSFLFKYAEIGKPIIIER